MKAKSAKKGKTVKTESEIVREILQRHVSSSKEATAIKKQVLEDAVKNGVVLENAQKIIVDMLRFGDLFEPRLGFLKFA